MIGMQAVLSRLTLVTPFVVHEDRPLSFSRRTDAGNRVAARCQTVPATVAGD